MSFAKNAGAAKHQQQYDRKKSCLFHLEIRLSTGIGFGFIRYLRLEQMEVAVWPGYKFFMDPILRPHTPTASLGNFSASSWRRESE